MLMAKRGAVLHLCQNFTDVLLGKALCKTFKKPLEMVITVNVHTERPCHTCEMKSLSVKVGDL